MSTRQEKIVCGEWIIYFEQQNASFELLHKSGCQVQGRMKFIVHPGQFRAGEWKIVRVEGRELWNFYLLDTCGERQGYLLLRNCDTALRFEIVQRAYQKYSAVLIFKGNTFLGKTTFACRTMPVEKSRVVQMASGSADSLLNDSLFDIDLDTALQFKAETVKVKTQKDSDDGKKIFDIFLQARAEDIANCFIELGLKRNFYGSKYIPYYRPIDRKRNPFPPTGWMSWNVYFDQAGEKENLDEARVGARKLKPYGLKIWSIESWQENSSTIPVSNFHNLTLRPHPEQFPHGMKWLANQIKKLGFIPGIWTVPFGTGDENFYKKHKSWFLHKPDGTPMNNWCGRFVLDPSQSRVRKHMEQTHRIMSHKWGYEFFKIDGISGKTSGYSAHFYEKPEVRRAFKNSCREPLLECVKALRKGIGKDRIFLACQGHYTGSEVLYCDASRIGSDVVSPNKPPVWHNYLDQARSTLASLFVNNIVWYCDPDTLLMSEPISIQTARLTATVIALTGQVMFAGDKLAQLSNERMWLIQRCVPVCDIRPLDLFPVYDLKPIWVLKISRPFGSWDVVSLFNWDENKTQEMGFTLKEIGLDEEQECLAYDFFNKKFLGRIKTGLKTRIPPKSNILIALHPFLNQPQLLSTDRHLTQGGVSLSKVEWNEKRLSLEGEVELVAKDPTTLTIYVPGGFEPIKANANSAKIKISKLGKDRTVKIILSSLRSASCRWSIYFRRC